MNIYPDSKPDPEVEVIIKRFYSDEMEAAKISPDYMSWITLHGEYTCRNGDVWLPLEFVCKNYCKWSKENSDKEEKSKSK